MDNGDAQSLKRKGLDRDTLDSLLRRTLRRGLRGSRKSKSDIAEQLSIRLARNVSVSALNKWAGEATTAWRIPADAVPILCEILQDDTLQRQLLSEQMRRDLERGEWVREHGWIFAELRKEIRALIRQRRRR